jgi:hypothetical protein
LNKSGDCFKGGIADLPVTPSKKFYREMGPDDFKEAIHEVASMERTTFMKIILQFS